jgi:hypothetical protein
MGDSTSGFIGLQYFKLTILVILLFVIAKYGSRWFDRF